MNSKLNSLSDSKRSLALLALKNSFHSYATICEQTWAALVAISSIKRLEKKRILYAAGELPTHFAFIYQGLVRGFVTDSNGNEYNKIFFSEGMYPGSMTALLTNTPTHYAFQAIEDSIVVELNFAAYRQLLLEKEDLKLYHIHYLEKNWVLAKDAREVQIVQQDASRRYLDFIKYNKALASRLSQYHIASHLGITPTQLSRIRKKL